MLYVFMSASASELTMITAILKIAPILDAGANVGEMKLLASFCPSFETLTKIVWLEHENY